MAPVKFLLVDDLEDNLVSLEALLRRDNLVCLKAKSGDHALELLLDQDVALALIDVQMPGLNGFELAELMRGNERTKHIPIIFVTAGMTDRQRRFRGYEAGAVDFIQKPIEPDILRSKADVFFELYRQRQHIAAQRDELQVQAEALREAGRRKDEFLNLLTHDIAQHKDVRARQEVLLREINHRIKNVFSVTAGLISLSARSAASADALASDLRSRLQALARAHDLTLPDLTQGNSGSTTVLTLLKAILAPHEHASASRISLTGADAPISANILTSLALVLHELTTNAAKYGALSSPNGQLAINIAAHGDHLEVGWSEYTPTLVTVAPINEGFGTTLEKAVLNGMGGSITREWRSEGLALQLKIPMANLKPGLV